MAEFQVIISKETGGVFRKIRIEAVPQQYIAGKKLFYILQAKAGLLTYVGANVSNEIRPAEIEPGKWSVSDFVGVYVEYLAENPGEIYIRAELGGSHLTFDVVFADQTVARDVSEYRLGLFPMIDTLAPILPMIPMGPSCGPPLPRFTGIYWPWLK